MKMTHDLPTRRVTVLAQDPSIHDLNGLPLFTTVLVPNDRLLPGPRSSRIHVMDIDANSGRMIAPAPDPSTDFTQPVREGGVRSRKAAARRLLRDPHFHAQNVHAIAASTLMEFESALGRHVSWGFRSGSHELKIAPHAFLDLNAFYSREDEALVFGYYPKTDKSRAFVFTCLCFDVIVHETTHAILDGLRSEYLRPASADQAAFHEAFSDIIAILSVFRSPEIVEHGLGGRTPDRTIAKALFEPEALRQTFLFGLANEVGEALSNRSLGSIHGNPLRRSVEIKPDPELYASEAETAGPHAFGEILVAAVLNTFIDIWSRRVEPLDPVKAERVDRERAIEEGAKAAQHLLRMCIRALDYLPSTNVTFRDYASALITADFETAPNDGQYGYRQALCNSFAAYGIAEAGATPDNLRWAAPDNPDTIVYGFDTHTQMQWDRESLFRFLWENMRVLGLSEDAYTRVVSVRPVVRHGHNGCVVRETVVEYTQQINLFASGLDRYGLSRTDGMPSNLYVELFGGGTLIFDDYGGLKYHIRIGVTGEGQQKRLDTLWHNGHYEQRASHERRFAETHLGRMTQTRPSRNGDAW